MICPTLAAVAAASFALSTSADVFDWRETLGLPLSPGSVAILVEHGADPEAQARWREALQDLRPELRAAAARACYAAGNAELVPALKEALAGERDHAAAAEEIRAIAALGAAADDGDVIAAAGRIPEVRALALASVGLARGADALAHLGAIREMGADEQSRQGFVRAALRTERSGLGRAAAAVLRADDPAAWSMVWEAVRQGSLLDNGIIIASSSALSPKIRAITYWNLAHALHAGAKVSQVAEAVLMSAPESEARPEEPAESWTQLEPRVAFDVLRRALGHDRREDPSWAQLIPEGESSSVFQGPFIPIARLLTRDERRALVKKKRLPPPIERMLPSLPPPFTRRPQPRVGTPTVAIEAFPRGYVTELAALTGCREGRIIGDLTYGSDGRPRTVKLTHPKQASEACGRTARILLWSVPLSALRGPPLPIAPRPEPQAVAIRFLDPKSLAWSEWRERGHSGGAPEPFRDAVLVGGDVEAPAVLREVSPEWPLSDSSRNIPGCVTTELVIDQKGRVADVRVLEGVEELSDAVVAANKRLLFAPTVLDGVARLVVTTRDTCHLTSAPQ
jgi:hypothetical protein